MSFTYFSELPPELRLTIWEYALPGPRTITISPEAGGPNQLAIHAPSDITLDALYHTSKDSHATMMKYYTRHYFKDQAVQRLVWFDDEIDTLRLDNLIPLMRYISEHLILPEGILPVLPIMPRRSTIKYLLMGSSLDSVLRPARLPGMAAMAAMIKSVSGTGRVYIFRYLAIRRPQTSYLRLKFRGRD